ncbi:hypothetical protein ACA578_14260 [Lactiplantibacillus plantarum]|jgi:hypothetical protein|uniref:hypothetical protein n=2 Tax=Lactiplantibacillus plantarum TaxID=1590 RepID=UPI001B5D97A8|nr:hypothetical protein [Lactiplantibacillus plantarum]
MQNFISLTVKTINDVVMLPIILGKTKKVGIKNNVSKTVGGFTTEDWKNIGKDMKQGLIRYGKS